MHDQALAWLSAQAADIHADTAADLGGRDVNGSCRHLFPDTAWTVVDLVDAPGVDVAADAADWRPGRTFDLVVCTEVLEHCERWREVIATAAELLHVGGVLLVTAATDPRAPHSAVDGGDLQAGEWYANIHPSALLLEVGLAGFGSIDREVHDWPDHGGDVYLRARRIDDGVEV